jgi:phosphate transport system substrate-binding protein
MKANRGFSMLGLSVLWLSTGGAAAFDAPLSGTIAINGSSTVAPVTMAAAELFQEKHPKVRISVGVSGTGGGFKKFLDEQASLRTDITNASRPITPLELERAKKLGVEFIEIPVAIDGMAVVVHPGNTFCDHLTVAELKRVWEPGSSISNWKDIRPGFPDLSLKLYGPGSDSGTFDYFTLAVVGKERASRSDYTASENDNVLVQGVSGDRGSLGYFGLSYYETNRSKLKLVAIDPGDGKAVLPSKETIYSGAYRPLARPLFIYVNKASFARPEVRAFVEFFADEAARIAEHPSVRYTALNEDLSKLVRDRVRVGTTGTVFADPAVAETADLIRLYGGR